MLTHVTEENQPTMVDVGGKPITHRSATARTVVAMPPEVMERLEGNEIRSAKGPVFQTAIIAGTMAAKRTWELIPMCHPIPIEDCRVTVVVEDSDRVVIDCRVSAHHKTGVEMEALTGATVAALTVYDMCKALSRNIVIRETVLVEKRGGKSDLVAGVESKPPGGAQK